MRQFAPIKTVGLFGPYGSGNLGDAAIQKAVMHNIKNYVSQAHFFGFSLNPADTEKAYGIRSYPIYRPVMVDDGSEDTHNNHTSMGKNTLSFLQSLRFIDSLTYRFQSIMAEISFLFRSYKILKGIDVLIISGGGQLDDYWGGAWRHPFALFKWSVMARVLRKTVIFLSVGVGSVTSSLSRFFIKKSLSLANYRSYRDQYSRQFVVNMGVKGENHVYPDLAFSLPVAHESEPGKQGDKAKPVVGVSPIAASAWTRPDDPAYQNYVNHLTSMIIWMLQENYTISFFSSQTSMDTPIIHDIRKHLNKHFGNRLNGQIIEGQISTINDLMMHIKDIDIVIASRLHSVLLSHLMHKPVLALSYDRKVDNHMSDMGLAEYCVTLEKLSWDVMKARFCQLESNREMVTRLISDKISGYEDALKEQYDRLFGEKLLTSRQETNTIQNL
jgi:polysaccharide pyruvyl transferase WcaK-like protein